MVEELPQWPSKGNRRRLEGLWLEQLEGHQTTISDWVPTEEAPHELYQGIEQFNSRLFWECHETLEHIWLRTPYPLRFFYHAIIKAAAGFYHMSRHNRHGARTKLADAVGLLRLFPSCFLGVHTDLLRQDVTSWVEKVEAPGAVDWQSLDVLATPRIRIEEGKAKPATGDGADSS